MTDKDALGLVERLRRGADRAKAAIEHSLHEGLTVEFAQMAQYRLSEAAAEIERLREALTAAREWVELGPELPGVSPEDEADARAALALLDAALNGDQP